VENDLIKCNYNYNYKEEMDLSTLTKIDLLVECAKLNISKCKSKTKIELIELINSKNKQSNIEFIIEENDDVENVVISSSAGNTTIVASPEGYERDVGYLKEFLDSIRNKNGTYKRMCISPLRYAGGKSKAIGLILENLPKLNSKKIVSPFFGGGSMELCFAQELGFEVIGYDIFEMLANFWNTLIHFKDEFVSELKKFHINETEFTYNRHVLLNYWEKVKPQDLVYKTKNKLELKEADLTLLDNSKIMQAVYYYYNMTLSYGPMFLGWPSSNEIDVDKFKRRIEKLEQMTLKNINVQCKRFEESLPLHKDDFLFLDPPYFLEGDSKMFKGMYPNCNFAIHHNNFDHKKLCLLLKEHRGGFLMTYNNCSAIRELYNDCKFEFPEWQYTYGQGETRIGKNREGGTNDNLKESHEIIIIKWPNSS
jgi:DNA adenine methylase